MTVALVLLAGVLLGVAGESLRAHLERARINRRCDAAAARRVVLLAAPIPRLPAWIRDRDGDAA